MSARKVTVGLLDIQNGLRNNPTENPISRAISREFGRLQVELTWTKENGLEARIGKGTSRYLRYWLPPDINHKLIDWNSLGTMKAFEFEIPETDLLPETPVTYVQAEDL